MSNIKLDIELVPSTSWLSNVRSILSKKQWDIIKSQIADQAYHLCEICGGVGPKHPVECHEIWEYDDKSLIQKLTGLIALCPNCHAAKHFGFSEIQGKREQTLKHFMKINGLSKTKAEDHIKKSFTKWNERSKKNWKLDISYLESFGIDVSKIEDKEVL